jgi:hypothetical protein
VTLANKIKPGEYVFTTDNRWALVLDTARRKATPTAPGVVVFHLPGGRTDERLPGTAVTVLSESDLTILQAVAEGRARPQPYGPETWTLDVPHRGGCWSVRWKTVTRLADGGLLTVTGPTGDRAPVLAVAPAYRELLDGGSTPVPDQSAALARLRAQVAELTASLAVSAKHAELATDLDYVSEHLAAVVEPDVAERLGPVQLAARVAVDVCRWRDEEEAFRAGLAARMGKAPDDRTPLVDLVAELEHRSRPAQEA